MNENINVNYIVQKTIQIMSGDVDFDTYHFAFSPWWDAEWEEFDDLFIELLDLWNSCYEEFDEDELIMIDDIALAAFEAAAHILYNVDISEVLEKDRVEQLIGSIVG